MDQSTTIKIVNLSLTLTTNKQLFTLVEILITSKFINPIEYYFHTPNPKRSKMLQQHKIQRNFANKSTNVYKKNCLESRERSAKSSSSNVSFQQTRDEAVESKNDHLKFRHKGTSENVPEHRLPNSRHRRYTGRPGSLGCFQHYSDAFRGYCQQFGR